MLYTKFSLENGLTVIHHPDPNTKLCVINILYKVGSRDEKSDKTGFAHLFEHLMFGGSVNIPDYDGVLQMAGGDNNAFTSNDITNYYLTLPFNNIETGFWLESDRMLQLDFNQSTLDIQKNVVQEEFKERYLNQPYGDLWLKLLPLAYKKHPYSWPTIGKELSHIADATLEQVKEFFYSFYAPNNAILVVAGNISEEQTREWSQKWFGDIPSRNINRPVYEKEPKQTEPRHLLINGDVPLDMVVKAYHTPARMENGYYETDLFSDILGMGKSSRLYQKLVKEKPLFSEIDCYITGDVDPGLLVIEGKLTRGVALEDGDKAIVAVIEEALREVTETELQKVKNKTETNILFNEVGVLNRAMKLAYCEMLGNIDLAENEASFYQNVTLDGMLAIANNILVPTNASTIYYQAKK